MLTDVDAFPQDANGGVLYWMVRDQRLQDNWAMLFAQRLALKEKTSLHVCFCLVSPFMEATERHYDFVIRGLQEVEKPVDWMVAKKKLKMDTSVKPVDWAIPGERAGLKTLESFCNERLKYFATERNDPTKSSLSNLSPWLHFGAYDWAKKSLKEHEKDKREYIYTQEQLENANTHDQLWNAAQIQLLTEGKMHGFLRMYWAKKILEWTANPAEALCVAIYLNDRYSLDGMDSNGYVVLGHKWQGNMPGAEFADDAGVTFTRALLLGVCHSGDAERLPANPIPCEVLQLNDREKINSSFPLSIVLSSPLSFTR
ncbi:phrB [Acanthosepion pharaonis]|uniref:Deoxyribodipyrimidine photo-lyase n=1 Tax=Acanthosepion pharaonis TaxID=158019 RepID=A0A812CJQ0_ACAPH|nr:phrB [Sepia pharaonis]